MTYPDSKVHGANMEPTWGRQDRVGPMLAHELCYRGYSCFEWMNLEQTNVPVDLLSNVLKCYHVAILHQYILHEKRT